MAGEVTGAQIDGVINSVERCLSNAAAIPIIGTLPGLGKVLMGVGQTIVGLVGGIFTSPVFSNDPSELNDRYWTHFKHGAGNVAAGAFEAIPLVGTAMYFVRKLRSHLPAEKIVTLITKNEDKFMPYKSLCERDFDIIGAFDEERKTKIKLFEANKKEVAETLGRNLTNKEAYKCAKLAIKNLGIDNSFYK